jgi:hypothetical protein
VWVSGTSDGIGCARTWGWCPSGEKIFANFPWYPNEPNGPYFEMRMQMQMEGDLANSKFNDMSGSNACRFICEVSLLNCLNGIRKTYIG